MENQEIKDIGKVYGRILVFGGVYSNLQALEGLKGIAENLKIPPSNIFCNGDIMGYCAQPNECLALIREWGILSISGNVEVNLKNNEEDCGCNFEGGTRCDLLSSNWYPYIRRTINEENKGWLHSLPSFIRFEYADKDVLLLHGGLDDNAQFIFESTDWDVKARIFDQTNSNVIIGGHCGLPFHSISKNSYWLNPGVIGMPANDGTSRVWYMILDDEDEKFTFQHLAYNYDHKMAANLMKAHGLPAAYAETLSSGIWDNMEILNAPEQLKRCVRIEF